MKRARSFVSSSFYAAEPTVGVVIGLYLGEECIGPIISRFGALALHAHQRRQREFPGEPVFLMGGRKVRVEHIAAPPWHPNYNLDSHANYSYVVYKRYESIHTTYFKRVFAYRTHPLQCGCIFRFVNTTPLRFTLNGPQECI